MKTVNYSELRQNMKANLDSVTDNSELLIVHRINGKSIVMMSLEEYNAIEETMHLLKSKENRIRLERADENILTKNSLLKKILLKRYKGPLLG